MWLLTTGFGGLLESTGLVRREHLIPNKVLLLTYKCVEVWTWPFVSHLWEQLVVSTTTYVFTELLLLVGTTINQILWILIKNFS